MQTSEQYSDTATRRDPGPEQAPPAALDAAGIQSLITESLGATQQLPEQHRIAELDEQLRDELDRLLPAAQQCANALNRGTPEWYNLQRTIDHTNDALHERPGNGRLSGALHVAELARRVCALQQTIEAAA